MGGRRDLQAAGSQRNGRYTPANGTLAIGTFQASRVTVSCGTKEMACR